VALGQAPTGCKKRRKGKLPKPTADLGLVGVHELSKALGLPVKWLRRWAAAGVLPGIVVGQRHLFDVEAVKKAVKDKASRFTLEGKWLT
jgi:hypothetical protein